MDDDQQFCLRWNNHQSTLVAVFDTLLENEKLVDCTLAAEGKFLNAHKVVLSACSPYFESLLSRHYDKHPILILKDVKFQELKAMMDYMYRGEVNISQDQLGALLKAAESLQIKGLSDNKREEPAAAAAASSSNKRPGPSSSSSSSVPVTPKSPQQQSQHQQQIPKVQGLTIEQRNRAAEEREGSVSPGPRKKKRMRRKSEDMDNNHHDASNSSDAHSLPSNIPSATTQLPANIKMNSSSLADVPDALETKQEILRHKDDSGSQQSQVPVPIIKEKLETHSELMLEPKAEYVDEMNEDSIEDLTLDDDDLSNMEQMDDGPGPSHGGEGSSQQGFGHWQMGNQSQDEVFLAAQEAVGAHRDSQGFIRRTAAAVSRTRYLYDESKDFQRRVPEASKLNPAMLIRQEQRKSIIKTPTVPLKSSIKRQQETLLDSSTKIAETAKIVANTEVLKPVIAISPSTPTSSSSFSQRRNSSGLLTDSLSCIFTRRNNHQPILKTALQNKCTFYEESINNKDLISEEAAIIANCPDPPRISQPTPNISMEDWFAAKQRILEHVNHDQHHQKTNESIMKVPDDGKCPDPPLIIDQVDPQGFDIEPPGIAEKFLTNSIVSPYVPSPSHERDEYEKYKSEKLKKDVRTLVLLQHKQQQQRHELHENYSPQEEPDLEKYHIEKEIPEEGYAQFEYDEQLLEEQQHSCSYESQNSVRENYQTSDELIYHQKKYSTVPIFKEPSVPLLSSSNQTMCHKCSFQTTNPKKLKDHLKFVHGEVSAASSSSSPSSDLFSRRDAIITKSDELFTRRGDLPNLINPQIKRRTVNIISSDILVAAATNEKNIGDKKLGEYYDDSEDDEESSKKRRVFKRISEQTTTDEKWT